MKRGEVEQKFPAMKDFPVRSPAAQVGGIVYFGRMLDKIRVHAQGNLPEDYQPNLGTGFDRSCVEFLEVSYDELVTRTKEGGTDEEILAWCFAKGRRPTDNQIHIWNEWMRKRGWNDDVSEVLGRRKREAGMEERSEIETMFQFIDADEGRGQEK
ncbi:MAG: DUF5069 domain-containing protein [Verrucomicrobiota bacterium]|nr:DUF5069 domain-containing protein [Verrucomicrobiota bacterium]